MLLLYISRHNGAQSYGHSRWNVGDVLGCALDLDVPGGEMRFYLNGEDLGLAFKNFDIGSGLYPAASLSHGESGTFAFSREKMQVKKGSARPMECVDNLGKIERAKRNVNCKICGVKQRK